MNPYQQFASKIAARSGAICRCTFAILVGCAFLPVALAQQPQLKPKNDSPLIPLVPQPAPFGMPADRTQPLCETRLNLPGLRFVGFSADGKWLRVGNTKGHFQKLSTSDLAPLGESEAMPPFGTASAAITGDKRRTVVGNWRGLAVFFDSKTAEILGQYPDDPETDPTPITAMKMDDKATWLVTGQRSSIVRMHAIDPPKLRWESVKLDQEISGVDLSSDGKLVAVSTGLLKDFNAPGKLVVLSATSGKIVFQHLEMVSKVNHVAISPNSQKILACDNESLKVFTTTGKLQQAWPLGGIQRIKFIDNDRIILSRFPGHLALFNLKEHGFDQIYTGHAKNPAIQEAQLLWALDIAPDGKSFASADTHGNVGLWAIE